MGEDSRVIGTFFKTSTFRVFGFTLRYSGRITLSTSLKFPRRSALDLKIDLRLEYALVDDFGEVFCFFVFGFHRGPPVKCHRIFETVPGDIARSSGILILSPEVQLTSTASVFGFLRQVRFQEPYTQGFSRLQAAVNDVIRWR